MGAQDVGYVPPEQREEVTGGPAYPCAFLHSDGSIHKVSQGASVRALLTAHALTAAESLIRYSEGAMDDQADLAATKRYCEHIGYAAVCMADGAMRALGLHS